MNWLKHAGLGAAILLTLLLVAHAQEKGCEWEGKTYEHGAQVWSLKGDERCWVCFDGEWAQRMTVQQEYCKGKY